MPKAKIDISEHMLIPKHKKLSEKEKKDLLEKYDISVRELPKILKNDPTIAEIDAKPGDVIRIMRKSPTAGDISFYRGVI